MKEELYYVIAFDSTHHAIQSEKILKNQGIDIKVIPTPREITVSCGLSLRFDRGFLGVIKETVDKYSLTVNGIYEIRRLENRKEAKKLPFDY